MRAAHPGLNCCLLWDEFEIGKIYAVSVIFEFYRFYGIVRMIQLL